MKPEAKVFNATVGGRTISVETGKLAGLAGGAVTLRLGDAMVFASATMSKEPRLGIDFFPLSVDYEERMYAGGRIPGGFFRREGRPSEHAILTARLTDRPLRPLFPKDMRNDVQVIVYALSADEENPMDVLCINAASAALTISDIPFGGPVGAVRIGRVGGDFVVNPTYAQLEESDLDLRIAGTRDAILMVECGADEIPEDVMVRALELGHASIQPLIDMQLSMASAVGKAKRDDYPRFVIDDALKETVFAQYGDRLYAALDGYTNKTDLNNAVDALQKEAVEALTAGDVTVPTAGDVAGAFDSAYKKAVRSRILQNGVRPDGRGVTDIRPIWCEVNYSPRAHGSGLFTRGETQILTLVTLGTPRDAQEMDNLTPPTRSGTSTTTTSRPSPPAKPAPCAGPPAAKSGTAPWPNAPSSRSSRTRMPSRTRSGSFPKRFRRTARPPWARSAARPWR